MMQRRAIYSCTNKIYFTQNFNESTKTWSQERCRNKLFANFSVACSTIEHLEPRTTTDFKTKNEYRFSGSF